MNAVSQIKLATVATMASLIMACSSNPKVEAPAPEPARQIVKQVEIVQTDRGPSLTLKDVQFDFEKATLRPESADIIARAASYMQENPERDALVEGHTDTSGDSSYNQVLSVERSRSIKDALIAAGISNKRIKTRGLGETQPVADNSTLAGRQTNRRVEIIFQVSGTQL